MVVEKDEKEAGCSESEVGEDDDCSEDETELATQESNAATSCQADGESSDLQKGAPKEDEAKSKTAKPKVKRKRKRYCICTNFL